MRSITFAFALLLLFQVTVAQSDRYTAAMEKNIALIDSARTVEAWTDLANNFERIAEAEKNQWLPWYYAALGNVMSGFQQANPQGGNIDKLDPIADKASMQIAKAEELSSENSEIFLVKKLIATLYMVSDPQGRWQKYGPMSTEALAKAKVLDPENPRIYLLEGQDKLYTPEEFGGSKAAAKELFQESEKRFGTFKPESALHPNWGLPMVRYYKTQTN